MYTAGQCVKGRTSLEVHDIIAHVWKALLVYHYPFAPGRFILVDIHPKYGPLQANDPFRRPEQACNRREQYVRGGERSANIIKGIRETNKNRVA